MENIPNIQELRNNYYEAIMLMTDRNQIAQALPKPEYGNFFQIMDGLIARLEKEKKEILELMASANDEEEREYLSESLSDCEFKLSIYREAYEKATKTIKNPE